MKRRKAIKSFIGASLLPFLPNNPLWASDECLTTEDILGPYFIDGAPTISTLAPSIDGVNRLFITGTVYANDCQTPIPNALIDVWHANHEGAYEDVNYRGKIYTDEAGNYAFESIQPGKYLNGSYYRPSHIHYKVLYQNNPEFVTQLYFEGDTSIEEDPWASNPSATNRIIPLMTDQNTNRNGVFDIYLDIDPETVNIPDFNRNDSSSKIQSISPNPIVEDFEIRFFINTNSQITIDLCDVLGQHMEVLLNISSNKGMKKFTLKKPTVESGIYIIRLSVDKLKVDAKRVFVK